MLCSFLLFVFVKFAVDEQNHSSLKLGLRFSTKAFVPSFLSCEFIMPMNRLLSCSMAAVSPTSRACFTARLVNDAAICDLEAIFFAIEKAASCSFA